MQESEQHTTANVPSSAGWAWNSGVSVKNRMRRTRNGAPTMHLTDCMRTNSVHTDSTGGMVPRLRPPRPEPLPRRRPDLFGSTVISKCTNDASSELRSPNTSREPAGASGSAAAARSCSWLHTSLMHKLPRRPVTSMPGPAVSTVTSEFCSATLAMLTPASCKHTTNESMDAVNENRDGRAGVCASLAPPPATPGPPPPPASYPAPRASPSRTANTRGSVAPPNTPAAASGVPIASNGYSCTSGRPCSGEPGTPRSAGAEPLAGGRWSSGAVPGGLRHGSPSGEGENTCANDARAMRPPSAADRVGVSDSAAAWALAAVCTDAVSGREDGGGTSGSVKNCMSSRMVGWLRFTSRTEKPNSNFTTSRSCSMPLPSSGTYSSRKASYLPVCDVDGQGYTA